MADEGHSDDYIAETLQVAKSTVARIGGKILPVRSGICSLTVLRRMILSIDSNDLICER
ncbi:MAG: hypothetical protein ACE14P_03015 [Methanotrichaceae archaeon]